MPELPEPPPLTVPELLEPPPLEVPEELPPELVPEPEPWVPDCVGADVVLGALPLPSPVPDPVTPVDSDGTEGVPEDCVVDVAGGAEEWVTGAVTAATVVTWTVAGWCETTRRAGCVDSFGSSSAGAGWIWFVVTTLTGDWTTLPTTAAFTGTPACAPVAARTPKAAANASASRQMPMSGSRDPAARRRVQNDRRTRPSPAATSTATLLPPFPRRSFGQ